MQRANALLNGLLQSLPDHPRLDTSDASCLDAAALTLGQTAEALALLTQRPHYQCSCTDAATRTSCSCSSSQGAE